MNIEVMTSRLRHRRRKSDDASRAPYRYRWELLPKVASNIEYGNRVQAHRDLDALLLSFSRDSGHDLELQKIRCFQTMSAVMRGARRGGAAADALFKDHLDTLNAISKLKSWRAVARAMHTYVDHLFTQTREGIGDSARARRAPCVQSSTGCSTISAHRWRVPARWNITRANCA